MQYSYPITDQIESNVRLYADDTCIFVNYNDPDRATFQIETKTDIGRLSQWASCWFVMFNPQKTIDITFSRKRFVYTPAITTDKTLTL